VKRSRAALAELLAVVRRLRRECPWDKRQTVRSTRPLVLNEAYELDEALASGDPGHMQEELGDYLFMGLFLADVLEAERGVKLSRSVKGMVAKLKYRHPHIYGKTHVKDHLEVLANWEKLKAKEKAKRSVLDGLPKVQPALKQAQLIQERCKRVGFDWKKSEDVLDKVSEEVGELQAELSKAGRTEVRRQKAEARRQNFKSGIQDPESKTQNESRVQEELGDLLFALVNLARHLGVDAESALRDANAKFTRRFQALEQEFSRQGKRLEHLTLEEMDSVWDEVKRRETANRRPKAGQKRTAGRR